MLAALLTDFGLQDTFVGAMHAVILSICPEARVVDLTHGVPPQDVLAGALALEDAAPYVPRGAAIVAVVDPGVGSARAGLAAWGNDRFWIGPDNGLLSWQLGPDAQVVRLESPELRLAEVSRTFHGRDVFAPAAAHLLRGVPLGELGQRVTSWVQLPRPAPVWRSDGSLEAHVVAVDRFGNLVLDARPVDLPPRPRFTVSGHSVDGLVGTYAEAVGLCALVGSSGRIEIAVPNGNAAAYLGATVGGMVFVTGR